MELKLEHVLLLLLFVFLFRHVKCNRLTEGMVPNGAPCTKDGDCGLFQDCRRKKIDDQWKNVCDPW